jgi:hypothetical protein
MLYKLISFVRTTYRAHFNLLTYIIQILLSLMSWVRCVSKVTGFDAHSITSLLSVEPQEMGTVEPYHTRFTVFLCLVLKARIAEFLPSWLYSTVRLQGAVVRDMS